MQASVLNKGGAMLIHEGEAFHFSIHNPSKLPVLRALCQTTEDLTMTHSTHELSLDFSNQEEIMDPDARMSNAQQQPPMQMHPAMDPKARG